MKRRKLLKGLLAAPVTLAAAKTAKLPEEKEEPSPDPAPDPGYAEMDFGGSTFKTMTRVAVSGGFDPLHVGHLALFKSAADFGRLTVIINSDEWLIRKKGRAFMPFADRAAIIQELECVDNTIEAVDDDGTVCETLKYLKSNEDLKFFCNGGDRMIHNTPESELCPKIDVEMVWGCGGSKIASSSALTEAPYCILSKPWGTHQVLAEGEGFKVKKLVINPGHETSLQTHKHRGEVWRIEAGQGFAQIEDGVYRMHPRDLYEISSGFQHRLSCVGDIPLEILEVQIGVCDEDDITRFEDNYGRASQ